jgi:hypothetical protein
MIHLTKARCRGRVPGSHFRQCENLTRRSIRVHGTMSVAYYGKWYRLCAEHRRRRRERA